MVPEKKQNPGFSSWTSLRKTPKILQSSQELLYSNNTTPQKGIWSFILLYVTVFYL